MAITIHGRKIFKDGAPYHPRGWVYSNIPVGGSAGTSFAKQPAQLPYDLADMKAAGQNCTRLYYDQYNSSEYTVALNLFSQYGIDVIMFYYIPHNVDYSVLSNRTEVISEVSTMITNLSGHSAIIGWGIGNEVNYELGGTPLKDYYTMLNEAIAAGKAIDSTRFYTTANGDLGSIQSTGSIYCPNIDVWGANVYRGRTFTDVRDDIIAATGKPVIVTEYGFDAYDSVTVGGEDQEGQAVRDLALTKELESYYPFVSGYILFQWADQWFKMGNNSTHDTTGNASSNDDRDQINQEEWFGSAEALTTGSSQSRTKRKSYSYLKNYWLNTPLPTSTSKRIPVV